MSDENPLAVLLSPADRRVADARDRLEVARSNTRSALLQLRVEVKERSNWRSWVRAHPERFLLTAFIAGYLLGSRR